MIGIFQRLRRSPEPDAIDPEVALIVQELDEELAREHGLVADDVGLASRDIGGLLRGFALRCRKVALVGSHRRGKAEPGDIDILYIPKSDLQIIEFLEQAADDEKQISQDGTRWTCTIKGKKVDFIATNESNWGLDLIQFTGSRKFNERMLRHVHRRGISIENGRPVQRKQDGYSSWDVPAFSGWSEEKILAHLGLQAYLDPHTREEV